MNAPGRGRSLAIHTQKKGGGLGHSIIKKRVYRLLKFDVVFKRDN